MGRVAAKLIRAPVGHVQAVLTTKDTKDTKDTEDTEDRP
jgi:hypothetical protein